MGFVRGLQNEPIWPIQNIFNTRGIFRDFRFAIGEGYTNQPQVRKRSKYSTSDVELVEFVS